MKRDPLSTSRGERGFTLIESLVSMLVMAGGLFGLLATQTMLARHADLARQRAEAVRLAQERVENLRSYTMIATTEGHLAWDDLDDGTDEIETNAAFTRTWTVAGSPDDPLRQVDVMLNWVDRDGQPQTVTMRTVISQTDPADVGALGFPLPANTTLKRPKNRSMGIPVPAIELGDGRSVYQLASNFAVLFDNDSGFIVQRCDHVVETIEDTESGCEEYEAYILAGYVSKTMSSFPSALGVSTAGLTGLDTTRTASCTFGDAKDQNTGVAIAGYKHYLCILPMNTGGAWSGTLRLTGMSTGTNYRVCRFQYASASGLSANARNVQPYVEVDDSMDGQNYIITTSGSCPTVNGLQTVLHQACTSSSATRVLDCPAV
jgi:prepilin-type N-terminal cleavage/methylation domain-containing protein